MANRPVRKDVNVHAETAVAYFNTHGRSMLFDPDRPTVDPNELLKELGGMTDPRLVNHNCPLCHKTMTWDLLVAHAKGCMDRWYSTLDVTLKAFPGASLERKDVTIESVNADANGGR